MYNNNIHVYVAYQLPYESSLHWVYTLGARPNCLLFNIRTLGWSWFLILHDDNLALHNNYRPKQVGDSISKSNLKSSSNFTPPLYKSIQPHRPIIVKYYIMCVQRQRAKTCVLMTCSWVLTLACLCWGVRYSAPKVSDSGAGLPFCGGGAASPMAKGASDPRFLQQKETPWDWEGHKRGR